MNTKRYFNAFTMAEAILVMVILGIIATIMISTMRPVHFRDKGLQVQAKKVINQFEEATKQILVHHTRNETLDELVSLDGTTIFGFGEDWRLTRELYNKYLVISREAYDPDDTTDLFKEITSKSSSAASAAPPFKLKDGSYIFLGTGEGYGVKVSNINNPTIIAMAAGKIDYSMDIDGMLLAAPSDGGHIGVTAPSQHSGGSSSGSSSSSSTSSSTSTGDLTLADCSMDTTNLIGIITIDINGNQEPNVMYKDQFHIPIDKRGVD
ncbi:type II secretion system protein, partial [bacterium]|nr:type II secretion system protein [bacterium]